MEESDNSKDEILDKTPTMLPPEPTVNILQLTKWLTAATREDFLLKPNDLKMMYLLMLWEYLSKHHDTKSAVISADKELALIPNDKTIAIPQVELVKMVQLVFHPSYYSNFFKIFNM
uniref:Uncharacterized protein n=1 Tax=Marseillevirus LCMAC201 TaxID=2506605 RepID=A0A481YVY7_9VIRU|nr:MAG: hypothetical protein LCMAC201_02680 [Marseillevirus LCMAC201]